MRIAVKYGALSTAPLVGPDGHAVTESGQATMARRLLELYPGAVVVGREARLTPEFEIVTLASHGVRIDRHHFRADADAVIDQRL